MSTILIVSQYPLERLGFKSLFAEKAPTYMICGVSDTAEKALKQVVDFKPDLVILDLNLIGPGTHEGFLLLPQIMAVQPDQKVLVTGQGNQKIYEEKSLQLGARGYLCKSSSKEQVLEGIKTILSGEVLISNSSRQFLLHQISRRGNLSVVTDPRSSLSHREKQVFALIGAGKGTRQVSEALKLSIKTVESHRAHIKGKLGLKCGSELVLTATSWGI